MTDQKNAQTEVVDEITKSIGRLHRIGGLGLVLVAGAIVTFASSAIFPDVAKVTGSIPRFYDFTLIMAVIGAAIGATERFLEYRLTARRLEMMTTVTEKLVSACIPKDHHIDTAQIRVITSEAFENVWKYSAPKKPETVRAPSATPLDSGD